MNFELAAGKIFEMLINYLPKVLIALGIFIIGSWGISFLVKLLQKTLRSQKVETTLLNFLSNLLEWGLKVLLFVVVITKLGVETSTFVAIFGAAGLAVGLALQGSLSNFAGGILIVLFKPLRVGDYIKTQDEEGFVREIQIFSTKILNNTNQEIFIPNGILSNSLIVNYSLRGTRRLDIHILVSYQSDLNKAIEVLQELGKTIENVAENPGPKVLVSEYEESAIKLQVRLHVKPEDYYNVKSDFLLKAKSALDNVNIKIQTPIREIIQIQK